jgi:hypothetical protein
VEEDFFAGAGGFFEGVASDLAGGVVELGSVFDSPAPVSAALSVVVGPFLPSLP